VPTAIITGQVGSCLAEFLLKKGYEVVGMVSRFSAATYEMFTISRILF
jgi:GDP-D-mannose dehydratase